MKRRERLFLAFVKEIKRKGNRYGYLDTLPMSGYSYNSEMHRLEKFYAKLPERFQVIFDRRVQGWHNMEFGACPNN